MPKGVRGRVYGIATRLGTAPVFADNKRAFEYTTWANMLKRCYDEKELQINPSYEDKSVCSDWLVYENFYDWCISVEHRGIGWQLDKDLLVKGNKVYGPEVCVFLPPRLNGIILKCDKSRGDLPVGVHFDKSRLKYKVTCQNEFDKQYQKRFHSLDEAFLCYKTEKERVIKVWAEKYKDEIDPRAYQALINYTVEITD